MSIPPAIWLFITFFELILLGWRYKPTAGFFVDELSINGQSRLREMKSIERSWLDPNATVPFGMSETYWLWVKLIAYEPGPGDWLSVPKGWRFTNEENSWEFNNVSPASTIVCCFRGISFSIVETFLSSIFRVVDNIETLDTLRIMVLTRSLWVIFFWSFCY